MHRLGSSGYPHDYVEESANRVWITQRAPGENPGGSRCQRHDEWRFADGAQGAFSERGGDSGVVLVVTSSLRAEARLSIATANSYANQAIILTRVLRRSSSELSHLTR